MADDHGDSNEIAHTSESEEDFIASITADVVACLNSKNFFRKLDDVFVPASDSIDAARCNHSFTHSISLLRSLGFDQNDIVEILQVLKQQGACCDCEVLYNVAEESRFKEIYWKSRAESRERRADTPPGHSGS